MVHARSTCTICKQLLQNYAACATRRWSGVWLELEKLVVNKKSELRAVNVMLKLNLEDVKISSCLLTRNEPGQFR